LPDNSENAHAPLSAHSAQKSEIEQMTGYQHSRVPDQERQNLVDERLIRGAPPHRPPHLPLDGQLYLLTAACYSHVHHLNTPARRRTLLDLLFDSLNAAGIELHAWVVLSNHYHLLVHCPAFDALPPLFRHAHGQTSFSWNREEGRQGRQIWYHYTDRAIRSERHYYTTLSYIHYNPVKHGLASSPYDWPWSSVHWYLEHNGREWLRDLWRRYPVRAYGQKWDND
jgi:putative transposase